MGDGNEEESFSLSLSDNFFLSLSLSFHSYPKINVTARRNVNERKGNKNRKLEEGRESKYKEVREREGKKESIRKSEREREREEWRNSSL